MTLKLETENQCTPIWNSMTLLLMVSQKEVETEDLVR